MNKSQIAPELAQDLMASAANAADKGQSQFFTPPDFAREVARPLPRNRLAVADLNAGAGHLIAGISNETTQHRLGLDIEAVRKKEIPFSQIAADLTLAYPPMVDVELRFDLLGLNPPFRLFWHRERLALLGESDLPAVRLAFKGVERGGGISPDCIDSTIATLLIALDRLTASGEGVLIANNATLERLLFAPDAPHAAAAVHIWAHWVVPGNPMTGLQQCNWSGKSGPSDFQTGVIYFARGHTLGRLQSVASDATHNPVNRADRHGPEIRHPHACCADTPERWQAIKEHLAEQAGRKPAVPWNLWLESGFIKTALNQFEQVSRKTNKAEVKRLFELTGKRPLECVLLRADREELLHVCDEGGWRVQPELRAAITEAVRSYHASRAPLYPLPDIQRLGYLDEQNAIPCRLDLGPFKAGQSYPLSSRTVTVTRKQQKPNAFTGEPEMIESTGQQLAFYIGDGIHDTWEWCFLDGALASDQNTEIPNAKKRNYQHPAPNEKVAVDYNLQDLVRHFVIPDVPDVATVNPVAYQAALALLTQLETELEHV